MKWFRKVRDTLQALDAEPISAAAAPAKPLDRFGRDHWEGAFEGMGPAPDALEAALDTLASVAPDPTLLTLLSPLDPTQFHQSRAAISGLRRLGASAIVAAPLVAAWLWEATEHAEDGYARHGLRGAGFALADLRSHATQVGVRGDAEVAEAAATLEAWFAEACEPMVRTLCAGPVHAGTVGYLRFLESATSDIELTLATVDGVVGRAADAIDAGEVQATSAAALRALQTLSGRLRKRGQMEQVAAVRAAATTAAGATTDECGSRWREPADAPNPALDALVRAVEHDPAPQVRQSALRALAQARRYDPTVHRLALVAIADEDADVRAVAAAVLSQFAEDGG